MSKKFDVEVRRTEVRTMNVQVTAENEADAETKAIEQAANRDFYSEDRCVSADYEVDLAEELDEPRKAVLTREQQFLADGRMTGISAADGFEPDAPVIPAEVGA